MKKTSLKRILALLMAGTMVFSLASCGEKTDDDTSGDSSSGDTSSQNKDNKNMDGDIELNEPGEFPIVKEGQDPVTLSVFTAPHIDTCTEFGRDVNPATKDFEDKLNIRLDWQVVSKADKTAQQNLLFTNDDYPDMIFNSCWNSAALCEYADAGYIIPFDEYLDEAYYWNEYKEYGLESGHPGHTQEVLDTTVMLDGKTYGFYSYSVALHTIYRERMWMYQPWLDKLGLKMPTTTDEFYNVLKAFKTKDPNGNGKSDEIPMAGALKSDSSDPRDFLLNAFTVYTGFDQNFIYNKGGKIQFTPTEDAYREGLEYLNKLSDEGLLIKDTWSQDGNSLRSLTAQDDQLLGCSGGGSPTAFTKVTVGEDGDWVNYKLVAPLEGPDGVQNAPYSAGVPVCRFNITNNCKYPRIAFRLGDSFYDKEIGNNLRWGLKGDYWDDPKEDMVGLDGKPAVSWKFTPVEISEDVPKTNFSWGVLANYPVFPTWHTSAAVVVDPRYNMESLLYDAAVEYQKYTPEKGTAVLDLIFMGDTATDVVDWRTSINEYVETEAIKFITEGITDDSWKAYLKELDNRGLQDMLKTYQEAYEVKQ